MDGASHTAHPVIFLLNRLNELNFKLTENGGKFDFLKKFNLRNKMDEKLNVTTSQVSGDDCCVPAGRVGVLYQSAKQF